MTRLAGVTIGLVVFAAALFGVVVPALESMLQALP